jgi:hypothetical protein
MLVAGCRSGEVKTVYVTYSEFGEEFLPQVIALYEQPEGSSPKTFQMVHVLYGMQARLPTEEDDYSFAQALCLMEGHDASGKPAWRLMVVERFFAEGVWRWKLSTRVGVDAEGGFSGAKDFPALPTWDELEKFVARAKLEQKIEIHSIKLAGAVRKSHRYYVRAKAYEEELKELYGSVPAVLSSLNQEIFGDDPPREKKN